MFIFLAILLVLLNIIAIIVVLWSKEILRSHDPSSTSFYTQSIFDIPKLFTLAEAQTDPILKRRYNRLATAGVLLFIFYPIVVMSFIFVAV